MRTIILCCLTLHNMVLSEKRLLIPMERNSDVQVRVGENVEQFFVCESADPDRLLPGSIRAFCATNFYLNSAPENM